jgi:hypothetical protein
MTSAAENLDIINEDSLIILFGCILIPVAMILYDWRDMINFDIFRSEVALTLFAGDAQSTSRTFGF